MNAPAHHFPLPRRALQALLLTLLGTAWFWLATTQAVEPKRGEALYQNHCTGCHQSSVHIRSERRATDLAAVRDQVIRWQRHLALGWKREDIDDVLTHLNRQYYRYDD